MSDASTKDGPSAAARYSAVSIVFHWTIAVLIVAMIFYGWWMEDLREVAPEQVSYAFLGSAFNWHKTVGILILVLSLARLAWRLGHPAPPLPAETPGYQRVIARGTHVVFYAIMIGVPIGGYVTASAYGDLFPIKLFDAIELPKLPVPQTQDFQEFSGNAHGSAAWVIIAVLALHVIGALKHHIVDRDGVLTRMIPGLNIPAQTNRPDR